MVDIIEWPICQLRPQQVQASVTPFSRSGGRSLGGFDPAIRSDLGWWNVNYSGIVLAARDRQKWQTWQAIRQKLGGRSGLIAVPVRSAISAPFASGDFEPPTFVPHDDDTSFSDGTLYRQGAISVQSVGDTQIGATVIKLRIIRADANMAGVRFSYQHALYETGPAIDIDGDIWTVPVSTTVRAPIPDGSDLEFDRPTCLCHLASDGEMAVQQDAITKFSTASVSFVEANDYWNQLALGLI